LESIDKELPKTTKLFKKTRVNSEESDKKRFKRMEKGERQYPYAHEPQEGEENPAHSKKMRPIQREKKGGPRKKKNASIAQIFRQINKEKKHPKNGSGPEREVQKNLIKMLACQKRWRTSGGPLP